MRTRRANREKLLYLNGVEQLYPDDDRREAIASDRMLLQMLRTIPGGTGAALVTQYLRFGIVGLGATLTHALIFVTAIELAGMAPLLANLVAFGIAVLVSFFGHCHWTFRRAGAAGPGVRALVRFVVVALTGLLLNSLIVYGIVHLLGWPYPIALLLMVSLVPLVVFALSRAWAFA
jgi:putative flippase GtrA